MYQVHGAVLFVFFSSFFLHFVAGTGRFRVSEERSVPHRPGFGEDMSQPAIYIEVPATHPRIVVFAPRFPPLLSERVNILCTWDSLYIHISTWYLGGVPTGDFYLVVCDGRD